jgi:hypothetical protein
MVVNINITIFWDMVPWGLRVGTNVSEKPAASIFWVEGTLKTKAAYSETVGTYTPDHTGLHLRTPYCNINGLVKTRVSSYSSMLISMKQQKLFYFTCNQQKENHKSNHKPHIEEWQCC